MNCVTGLIEFLQDNAAIIVSVCALVLTSVQMWLTRRHNKLSVQPHLTTYTTVNLDSEDRTLLIYQATLTNSGLGPAFIKSYHVLIDEVPLHAEVPGDLFAPVSQVFRGNLDPAKTRFGIMRKQSVLAKDKTFEVATLALRVPHEILTKESRRFQLRVIYSSAYCDTFTYDTKQHQELSR